MDEERDQPAIAAGEQAAHRPLGDDLRGLVDSGLALARAEVELQQARAGYAAGKLKGIALLGLLALTLVFFALVALTVGLVVGLTPLLGAIGATLAVFGGLLLVAAVSALVAASQWKRMTTALANPGAE
jgi:uncharacterized membrane protein YqjE